MAVTFYDWKEAAEYAKQKQEEGYKEGYKTEICGGASRKGQREKHIVKITGREKPSKSRYEKQFSPYRRIDPLVSNDTIVRQFKKEGKPPLRTKRYIQNLAKRLMGEASVPTVDVKVTSTKEMGKHTDADTMYYEYTEKGKEKLHPFMMIIHPIHYSPIF